MVDHNDKIVSDKDVESIHQQNKSELLNDNKATMRQPETYDADESKNKKVKERENKAFLRNVFNPISATIVFILCIVISGLVLQNGNNSAGYVDDFSNITTDNDAYTHAPLISTLKEKSTKPFRSIEDLYKNVSDGIVLIEVYNHIDGKNASASGMVVSKDGYIVTCDHIYSTIGSPRFKVTMSDGTQYDAEYVAADSEVDIAILKITGSWNKEFKTVEFGDSRKTNHGENCVILGFPAGNTAEPIITAGVVGSKSVEINNASGYVNKFIQVDAIANPGTSGGAVFDMSGHVIGIVTSKNVSANYEASTYCIDSVVLQSVVNQLIMKGTVERVELGVTFSMVTNKEMTFDEIPYGCKIVSIDATSGLFDKAEIGEIIVECNGKQITPTMKLYDILSDPDVPVREVIQLKIYNSEMKMYRTIGIVASFRYSSNSYMIYSEGDNSSIQSSNEDIYYPSNIEEESKNVVE